MITTIFIAKIFATLMGCFALGFGIGKSVAYTRALGTVS